jgi:hypothetical protein
LRPIAKMLAVSPETVWLYFLRLGCVPKTLHWVPDILMDDLRVIRVEICQTMLAALRMQEHSQWPNILTGDENWFYFEYFRDRL